MMMWQKKALAVALSSLLLTGCFSDDDAAAEASVNVSIKERRSQVLTGATASGDGNVTVAWTQVSGPDIVIAGADTLTPEITAPSIDKDTDAVLRLTVTDSKGQVAEDELTVSIVNNTLPQLTAQPTAQAEKTDVTLTSALTDDGEITAVTWLQTAGPIVELSSNTGATVSFTTPAVTELTTLSFMLSVTDDDDETAELVLNVDIEPNLVALTLAGQVAGADFSGGSALLKGAQEQVTTEVDANGAFSFSLQMDDDLLNGVISVEVSAVNNSRLKYSAVYSGFTQPETVGAASFTGEATSTQVSAAADSSNTVTVSAVSTALYSLLVTANGGVVPANIEQLVFVEKSVDADELSEAAAVVKILTENPDIELPDGVTDISALLANVAAYNTLVKEIEIVQPGLIAETEVEIIADPTLTPPITTGTIAAVYYQTSAAAPGFLSRSGDQWLFNQDGTGSRSNSWGSDAYSWSIDDKGEILVNYLSGNEVTSFPVAAVGVAGLTAEQVSWLQADDIYQVQVEIITTRSLLTRIGTGQQIDSFNIENTTTTRLLPVQTSQGVVETTEITEITNGNYLMRKHVSNEYVFAAADMPGDWAINSYYAEQVNNQATSSFYLDVLRFYADGTGIGRDTDRTFNWTESDAVLGVEFSDGSKLEARIIDVSGNDYQVSTVAKNSTNKVIAAQADYGFRVDHDAEVDWATGDDNYWQTTINSWDKYSWDNGRLLLCHGDPLCAEEYSTHAAFGWQFNADFSGNQISVGYDNDTLPPEFEPTLISLNWATEVGNADWLPMYYYIGSHFYQRTWSLLKIEAGVLGTRIYVQERAYFSNPDYEIDDMYIGSRINMYEQIPVSYWNDSLPENAVNALSVVSPVKATTRLVVNPTPNSANIN